MERERPCECSESLCLCKANCRLPAAKFVKCATVEALCTPCAEYALASYDGAREIDPIDERLNRFEREHPHWAKFLGFLPRYLIARWFISYR
jgi:hypothetical protein